MLRLNQLNRTLVHCFRKRGAHKDRSLEEPEAEERLGTREHDVMWCVVGHRSLAPRETRHVTSSAEASPSFSEHGTKTDDFRPGRRCRTIPRWRERFRDDFRPRPGFPFPPTISRWREDRRFPSPPTISVPAPGAELSTPRCRAAWETLSF